MEPELEQAYAQLRRFHEYFKNMRQKLNKDEKQLKIDRENFNADQESIRSIDKTDVFHLNIGGEILATTRQTLTLFPKSLLSILFNGRWENRLQSDDDGNRFFDFNPIIFRHLLDQIQLYEGKTILLPSDPSLIKSFEKMLKQLRLEHLLSSSSSSKKNIITVNVDGQIITTQISDSTLNNIITSSNHSKLSNKDDAFIDHHPNIFRHFLKFRREKKLFEINCKTKSFSINEQIFLRPMLNDWRISCDKQFSMLTMPQNTLRIENMKDILNNRNNPQLVTNLKWKQSATTIAGGNEEGDQLDQLNSPEGIYIDHSEQSIYIADYNNNRIVKQDLDENDKQVIVWENGKGDQIDQLNNPTAVVIDRENNSLIICDQGNRRVVRWSLENQEDKQIIIENIDCWGLTMNDIGDLFVANLEKGEVKKWRKGENEGTLVAGGNGQGDKLNQLNGPSFLFIDRQETVYVSDSSNNRVMKWVKGAKEGIIVAGGQGQGNSTYQLDQPQGIIVNEVGDIYIADSGNYRIMCWPAGSNEGYLVVGNGLEQELNKSFHPRGLSFDHENNLYVADDANHQVQRFAVDHN